MLRVNDFSTTVCSFKHAEFENSKGLNSEAVYIDEARNFWMRTAPPFYPFLASQVEFTG